MLERLFFLMILIVVLSCTEDNLPREKAYPRIVLEQKDYIEYQSECNYKFEIPSYAVVEKKETFRNEKLNGDSCWLNIQFPDFNGTIHLSYKYYNNQEVFANLLEDSYKLTSKHMRKATYIRDSIIDGDKIKGLLYDVGGNSASDKQFFLTDDKNKFVRGALYFNHTPNVDSMRPILNFIEQDIHHLIATFEFQN